MTRPKTIKTAETRKGPGSQPPEQENLMTTTETWLDIMPAIPLARGVAFLLYFDGCEEYCGSDRRRVCLSFEDDYAEWVDDDGDFCSTPECDTRVDLDDPQGFGYALRQWWIERGTDIIERLQRYHSERMRALTKLRQSGAKQTASVAWSRWEPMFTMFRQLRKGMMGLTLRWLRDETTDADRLALAHALAEVTR